MRKTITTILLFIFAVLSVLAAILLYKDGSLARLTGWYHFRPGMHLFPEENRMRLKDVTWMRISDLHDTIECVCRADGSWWIISPFVDRMSPTAAQYILSFSGSATLVDTLPLNRTTRANLREYGVETSPHTITLKVPTGDGSDMTTLARYTLGNTSPWYAESREGNELVPTTYLRTDFYGRDKRIHVVSGNILPIFRNGLEGLRDPHLLSFEPDEVLSFTVENEGRPPITITRQSAEMPWVISAPIISEADQGNVDSLVSLISRLSATRIEEKSAVKLPPAPAVRISLRTRGRREPMQVELYPPFSSAADGQQLCYATVNDRNLVFTLPVEPRLRRKGSYYDIVNSMLTMPILPADIMARVQAAADTVYTSELRTETDHLRSQNFSNVNVRDIDKVYIRSRLSRYPVKMVRIPGDNEGQMNDVWQYTAAGQPYREADPEVVAEFLNSLGNIPVAGFERDVPPLEDMQPVLKEYGLNQPDYLLILQPRECEVRATLFGVDLPLVKDRAPRTFYLKRYRAADAGSYWVATEQGSHSIYRLSPKMMRLFAFSAEAWKKRNMMQFPISALRCLTLHYLRAELKLEHDYIGGKWSGTLNGEDVTPRINPNRADYFARYLQHLRVDRWLASDDEDALEALAEPAFSLSVYLEEPDYSDIEDVVISHGSDIEDIRMTNSASNLTAAQATKLMDESDEENEKFLRIATADQKIKKRTITIEIAPVNLRSRKSKFYGRIRETGEIFILSFDKAQALDGGLLDYTPLSCMTPTPSHSAENLLTERGCIPIMPSGDILP